MKILSNLPFSIRISVLAPIVLVMLFAVQVSVEAQDSKWIWSPKSNVGKHQRAECYFRKKFTLVRPEKSQLTIAAGDQYELYINGRIASKGASYGSPAELDVTSFLQPGVNLIAAKVEHIDGDQVGLALKLRVKERSETRWRSLVTDETWKSRLREVESWKTSTLNDIGWLAAQQIQSAASINTRSDSAASQTTNATPKRDSKTIPAKSASITNAVTEFDRETVTPSVSTAEQKEIADRFEVSNEFTVQQVMQDSETGSLIAMTFNEFGKLLVSREGGPLLIADLSKPVNDPNRIRVLCDQVSTCQGLLALNGDVFVTGEGPSGLALYRLTDADKNGVMEATQTLLKFTGKLGEHGPHGLALGPDGMIYVNIGNASQVNETIAPTSPYRHPYEGDLVARYEDPGGHAKGIVAPGGTIVRVSLDGSKIETVAGGLRNSYDVVFDKYGELFVHDSDMESDMGMTWYRPTKIFHVADGAEMGWRSGWAKYPDYFADQTPSISDTGRGSPTGAVIYQHLQFPARYHEAMFLADWSEGRILALKAEPQGAGYTAKVEEFLSGRPMNVSDLAVGEDGALYFCTGGRGTAGGVYRVVWNGQVPEKMLKFQNDLEKVIRHPQPSSSWARQNIAQIKQAMGETKWNKSIIGVADETRNTVKYRLNAMDKMVLYGPFPGKDSMARYAADEHTDIRMKAAQLCGLKRSQHHLELLGKLVADQEARVRRVACTSFIRIGETPPMSALTPMAASTDRFESLIARRALERIPLEQWSEQILEADDIRLFINGSLAMMTAYPSLENSYKVLARCSQFMEGFVGDEDFVDLLRVIQLSLIQGKVDPAKVPAFANRIGNEFPSGNGIINRELSRIMAFLKVGSLDERIVNYLKSDSDSDTDKLHVALNLQLIGTQLSGDERLALIDYLESAHDQVGGGSYKYYVSRAIRDVADTMTTDQIKDVLENGERWPTAVISAFYKMPSELDAELLELMKQVDQRAAEKPGQRTKAVRLGVIAILAQSGHPDGMEYLRQLWQNEPERRGDIAIGLAQEPDGPNWAYLISSLPVIDDLTSNEVLEKLAMVYRRPRDAGHYRAVIELGFRLRANGARNVVNLLEHWTGEKTASKTEDWAAMMNQWKSWFEKTYPNEPKIELKQQAKQGDYSTEQVLSFIETNGLGDANHGKQIFTKAQCALCHRLGAEGTSAGPELTNIVRRFSTREIVDSIIHPSNVVPEQYRSMTILTTDGETFSGMATEDNSGSWLILQADGKRVRVENESIEKIKETDVSSMPARLLDGLSMQDVADLMAYLNEDESQQTMIQSSSDVR